MTRINLKPRNAPRMRTLYDVLRVPPAATLEEMKAAYYGLAREYHSRGDYAEGFAEVTEAWSVLRDGERRRKYDAKLLLSGSQCATCEGKGVVWRLRKGNVPCDACAGSGQK